MPIPRTPKARRIFHPPHKTDFTQPRKHSNLPRLPFTAVSTTMKAAQSTRDQGYIKNLWRKKTRPRTTTARRPSKEFLSTHSSRLIHYPNAKRVQTSQEDRTLFATVSVLTRHRKCNSRSCFIHLYVYPSYQRTPGRITFILISLLKTVPTTIHPQTPHQPLVQAFASNYANRTTFESDF